MAKTNGTGPDVFGRVFTLKDDLRQRDVTVWNRAFLESSPPGSSTALTDEWQAALEAAIVAGWIVTPECRYEDVIDGATGQKSRRFFFDGVDIEDMKPAEVRLYGRACNDAFNQAIAIPKPSS